jgi:CubicO group peptidase (beta-lactamase class C family)
MAPAGQLWSTVRDLARYADFLVTGHPEVLSLQTLEEMSTPQSGTLADGLSSGYGLGLRLLHGGSGLLQGHTGSMPGFQASLFVDRDRRTGVAVLANSTTGLRPDRIAIGLLEELERNEPALGPAWEPVAAVPSAVAELLGVWHWGNTPQLVTWDGTRLHLARGLSGERDSTFRLTDGVLVGTAGYHHGEPLVVVRRADGSVSHLVCSTFVLTRTPYDPSTPIPGGAPSG